MSFKAEFEIACDDVWLWVIAGVWHVDQQLLSLGRLPKPTMFTCFSYEMVAPAITFTIHCCATSSSALLKLMTFSSRVPAGIGSGKINRVRLIKREIDTLQNWG
jgi:hypothetical protein